MTGAQVMAEDLLFATLDPTMRAVALPGIEKAILSDTVGFISDLPTQLVAAFRATLEEVTAADVIVHVRDMANPDAAAQKREVLDILSDLGVMDEDGISSIPIIEAWNKWDALSDERRAEIEPLATEDEDVIAISAVTGMGVDILTDRLGRLLTSGARRYAITLSAADGSRIAWLHAHGQVFDDIPADADGVQDGEGPFRTLDVRLTDKELGRFETLGDGATAEPLIRRA